MSQLVFAHRHSMRHSVREHRTVADHVRAGQVALMFGLLLIIGVLSLLYLMQFSKVATKGYEITRLEVERNKLLTEREVMSVKVARERSLSSFLKDGSSIGHMITADRPEFFHAAPVAAR